MALGLGCGLTHASAISKAEYSWVLDGTDDHINLGRGALVKPTTTDTSEGVGFTAAFWCKNDAWGEGSGDFVNPSETMLATIAVGGWAIACSTRVAVNLAIDKASSPGYEYLQVVGSYKPFYNGRTFYRASMWHHIAITFDGRYLKLYTDGVLDGTADAGEDDNPMFYNTGVNDVECLIGADPTSYSGGTSGTGSHWTGLIDDVAIWNTALDIEALDAIYEAVNTDGVMLDLTKDSGDYDYSSNMTGLWRANEGGGSVAIDDVGSNNGVVKNGVGYSLSVPS